MPTTRITVENIPVSEVWKGDILSFGDGVFDIARTDARDEDGDGWYRAEALRLPGMTPFMLVLGERHERVDVIRPRGYLV